MRKFSVHFLHVMAIFLLLGSCTLPRGAARRGEVLRDSKTAAADLAIYPVTRSFLPAVASWPQPVAAAGNTWLAHQRGAGSPIIATGDLINLAIWDNNANSLVTAPGQKMAVIKGLRVTSRGTVYVPYLEDVHVAGQTPDSARMLIQEQMDAILPSAQVQLDLISGRGNTVDLVGGVVTPGSYALPDRNFTVLNLISQGGGVPNTLRNPRVKLMRDGRIYATALAGLYDNPALDTTLRGGDKVIIAADDRYFLSLGAAGKEELVYFERDKVSALDAMSLIGGLSDARANPKGILIMREYPDSALRPGVRGPLKNRVVFTLDLTTSDGLFSARRFAILPEDLVLVTESPITSVQTVFGLAGQLLGLSGKASNVGN